MDWISTEIKNEEKFREIFNSSVVVKAIPASELPLMPWADMGWALSDGRFLAMEVSKTEGCDTCGYGAGEKSYWLITLKND